MMVRPPTDNPYRAAIGLRDRFLPPQRKSRRRMV